MRASLLSHTNYGLSLITYNVRLPLFPPISAIGYPPLLLPLSFSSCGLSSSICNNSPSFFFTPDMICIPPLSSSYSIKTSCSLFSIICNTGFIGLFFLSSIPAAIYFQPSGMRIFLLPHTRYSLSLKNCNIRLPLLLPILVAGYPPSFSPSYSLSSTTCNGSSSFLLTLAAVCIPSFFPLISNSSYGLSSTTYNVGFAGLSIPFPTQVIVYF